MSDWNMKKSYLKQIKLQKNQKLVPLYNRQELKAGLK